MVGVGIAGCDECGCEEEPPCEPCACVPTSIIWPFQYTLSSTLACYDCEACPNAPPIGDPFDMVMTPTEAFTREDIEAIIEGCTLMNAGDAELFLNALFGAECVAQYYYGEIETDCYTCRRWSTTGPGCDDLSGLPAFIATKQKSLFFGVAVCGALVILKIDLTHYGEGASAEAACENLCAAGIYGSVWATTWPPNGETFCCGEATFAAGNLAIVGDAVYGLYWRCEECYPEPSVNHAGCSYVSASGTGGPGIPMNIIELVC